MKYIKLSPLFLSLFFLMMTTAAWASPYPECDVSPTPPSKPTNGDYTRYVSLDDDMVFRFSGNFISMYYWPNSSKSAHSKGFDTPYQYLGGNGALMIMDCGSLFCFGVEQSIGAVIPYSGASRRLYGATYGMIGFRFLVGQRSIITFDMGGGVVYEIKEHKGNIDLNKNVFINTRFGGSVIIDLDWTIYLVPDFGLGLHVSPGLIFPDDPMSRVVNLECGAHFTVKY